MSWEVSTRIFKLIGLVDPSPLADPIAQVHQAFCENLLERAVDSLVKPQTRKEVAGQEEEESW